MTPAAKAWLWLAGGVVAYELACQPGELLSEQVDRWLLSHPVLTRTAIAVVALHLGNALPSRADPIHALFVLARG